MRWVYVISGSFIPARRLASSLKQSSGLFLDAGTFRIKIGLLELRFLLFPAENWCIETAVYMGIRKMYLSKNQNDIFYYCK